MVGRAADRTTTPVQANGGMSMGGATFPHVGGIHTLVMGRLKLLPDYGCTLSQDASRRFYHAYREYD